MSSSVDVVVLGSGGAGLTAAVTAAAAGAAVVVLERSPLVGGTTSVSGGMVWVPNNHHMHEVGVADSPEDALEYLLRCSRGQVSRELCAMFVAEAPRMAAFLEATTPVRFRAVARPDYRPEWPGARPGGRTLDNEPFDASALDGFPLRPRRSPVPLTHDELMAAKLARRHHEVPWEAIRERERSGVVTMGAALTGALVRGCLDHGVEFRVGVRARDLVLDAGGRVAGVQATTSDGDVTVRASHGVVVATGGFEWNESYRRAFLARPMTAPISPPWNDGDALRLGGRVAAALDNMTEAWWVPAVTVPDEVYDGFPLARHLGSDLSLPGSILLNRAGCRFVNESVNYNDLSASFAARDSEGQNLINLPCWLVFDDTFRRRYQVATTSPAGAPPGWWHRAPTIGALAASLGIDVDAARHTVARFNRAAARGSDPDFGRGDSAHDRFYGDAEAGANPCLGPLRTPPFYAIEVRPGAFGTKGGLAIDPAARVLDVDGAPVPGLFAAGNASAGFTGPGYPGAGATLGSALTFGYRAGQAITGKHDT